MTLIQLISILRARWLSALLVFFAIVSLAVLGSVLMEKKYTANASIVVDVRIPDPVVGVATPAIGVSIPNYIATQMDIILSKRVARRVVRNLKLTEGSQARAQWEADTGGRGDFEAWMSDLLQAKLRVKPARESSVIHFSYTSADPKFSATLVNAFIDAYIQTNRDLRVDPAKVNNTFFDERARQMRADLETAQARMSAYQREKGLTANDERLDVETARLNELSTQLVTLQAISTESRSRQGQVRSAAGQMTEVLGNPVVAGLKSDISRQEARLKELNSRLGDAHPQVVELRASIADLRSKMEAEIRRVGNSLGINANVNRSRENEVRVALDAQRARVLKLKAERNELAVQQRDVDNAQKAYDAMLARATQTGLESQSQLTNVSVLSTAEEPTRPSSPVMVLNLALGVLLGGLLGLGFALAREALDRRVRSSTDIVKGLDLPIIGVLPRAVGRRWFGGQSRLLPQRMLGLEGVR
jgi:polysaccharide biosynthesis transport protein